MTGSTATEPDSPRKRELLEAAYRYVLDNGLAGMSLRPLARQIGSSPRVLLFLFGSKEGLIRALLARAREDELSYLEEMRPSRGAREAGREVWAWLAAPSHRALLALWVEGYARSLLGDPGPWAGFGRDTVHDWLELLAGRQPAGRRETPQAEAERTLLLAVLRGALLDLLATGDIDRVTAAVEYHLRDAEQTDHGPAPWGDPLPGPLRTAAATPVTAQGARPAPARRTGLPACGPPCRPSRP